MLRWSRVCTAAATVTVLTVTIGCSRVADAPQTQPAPNIVATSTTVVPVEEIAFDADFCAALQGTVATTAAPPGELSASIEGLVAMLETLRSTAPPELAGDVRLFADLFERTLPVFENADAVAAVGQADADTAQSVDRDDISPEALNTNEAILGPMLGVLGTPELQAAMTRVTAYSALRCTPPPADAAS